MSVFFLILDDWQSSKEKVIAKSNYDSCFRSSQITIQQEIKICIWLYVYLSAHRCICIDKKNQLDVTEWFIALIIRSTCFGHFYAHHQELETICVLLPPMVCSTLLLVVGGRVPGSRLCVQKEGCCTTAVVQTSLFLNSQPAALRLTSNNQQPSTAHHMRQ